MNVVAQPHDAAARVTQPFAAAVDETPRAGARDLVIHSKQYRITGQLGEGGMGTVYRAYDPVLERDVALKVMKPSLPTVARRCFRAEAIYGARLCHPNLVRIFDLGIMPDRGLEWFAMEFLRGKDLERLLQGARRRGLRFSLNLVAQVFDGILDALDHAHRHGVVHRDVKPANIFITRDAFDPDLRIIKLLDFGVARDLGDGEPEDPRLILGDPRYLPPEQSRPQGVVDPRTDLYALGMTFYEAVTGHHPFEDVFGQHPRVLLECQRDRTPEPPSVHMPAGAEPRRAMAIDVFFRKACAKDPERRFADARTMQQALAEVRRFA